MADNCCIRLHFVDDNRVTDYEMVAETAVVPLHNVYWDMEMGRNIVKEELADNHIDSCLDYMDIVVVAQDNSHSQTVLHNFDD